MNETEAGREPVWAESFLEGEEELQDLSKTTRRKLPGLVGVLLGFLGQVRAPVPSELVTTHPSAPPAAKRHRSGPVRVKTGAPPGAGWTRMDLPNHWSEKETEW